MGFGLSKISFCAGIGFRVDNKAEEGFFEPLIKVERRFLGQINEIFINNTFYTSEGTINGDDFVHVFVLLQ